MREITGQVEDQEEDVRQLQHNHPSVDLTEGRQEERTNDVADEED